MELKRSLFGPWRRERILSRERIVSRERILSRVRILSRERILSMERILLYSFLAQANSTGFDAKLINATHEEGKLAVRLYGSVFRNLC